MSLGWAKRVPRRPRRAGEDASPITAPRAPTAVDASAPWPAWELAHLPERNKVVSTPVELLEAVTSRPKITIDRLCDVPPELVSCAEVSTRMCRPRSLASDPSEYDWYPQVTRAFVLHLSDAFIGDNVVFDRDRYYGLGRWWLGNSWDLYANVEEVRHIEAGVSIGGWGGEAFQHFVISALPKLAMVIDLLETPEFAHLKIVSHEHDAPAARWFWQKLRLTERIVQKPKDARAGFVVHADLVLFPQFDPALPDYALFARNTLRPLQRRLGTLEPRTQDLVLYLERPCPDMLRAVANDEQLIASIEQLLAGTGYRLHRFSSRERLDDDMELFQRAKVVVGPHGGAFANLIFTQPGTHVIEFLPIYDLYRRGEDPRPHYWGLAQAAGLDYWAVEPQNFDFHGRGMVVDVEEVTQIVRLLLA